MKPEVTVVTPYHPAREHNGMLVRASRSVEAQSVPVEHIKALDVHGMGAAVTRNHGLALVETEWTAFLDSDDELDPGHVEQLLACARDTGADYVYPWFRVVGGSDPFPMFFGRPWDNAAPHQTTITILVRTELAQSIGFLSVPENAEDAPDGNRGGEDWIFTLRCIEEGAKIVHLPERTWTWFHHAGNTSGCSGRGDAG